jgi:hypothetical protein
MRLVVFLFFSVLLCSCGGDGADKKTSSAPVKTEAVTGNELFRLLSPAESGVNFQNNITEDGTYNYFTFQYAYNGGGVAAGDINNDGLVDLYFTGNQVQDRLYLNKGDLKFEDITSGAGIANQGAFNFGVTMADVNQDGYQDIYVCRSGHKKLGKGKSNLLYINNGDMTFTESAEEYGLADIGYSIMAAFFDYDQDGDLDLYLTNHPVDYGQNLNERLANMKNPDYEVSDRLYQNNGNNTFSDVSKKAGILNYGHGLGLVIWDINNDGLDDIYVGNDYQSPDYVYINNGDGTFTDKMTDYFQHIPYYSMGVDVGDINNDGDLDINVVEMLPQSYGRRIKNVTDLEEDKYYAFERVGFHHQYMRNVLSKNNGNGTFTDIAHYAGVEATDWSWSTLIEDFDNDGWQDIFVSNGYLRDMQDKDYMKRAKILTKKTSRLRLEQIDSITSSVKLRNYMYQNKKDYQFKSSAKAWGLKESAFSYGAASADLDNDGDLDLVLNNSNLNLSPDPAFIYENIKPAGKDFIQFDFEGPLGNRDGEGARVELEGEFGKQIKEMRRTRGYQSSVPRVLHFGLKENSTVNFIVTWPDGKTESQTAVQAGQRITLKHSDAGPAVQENPAPTLFKEVNVAGLNFEHRDQLMNEFLKEKQLPVRLGMQGPSACKGDVNGDGTEDLFICGGAGQAGQLFLNNGKSMTTRKGPWEADAAKEGIDCSFADVDQDGDLDLYVGNGSIEFEDDKKLLADDLYINDGKGNFFSGSDRLPQTYSYTSAVRFDDVDADGDQDIFIGTRSVPFKYGEPALSLLYINDGGMFSSRAQQLAPALVDIGMVTDAAWADLDMDGDTDLIVVGDWMPVQVLINNDGKLIDKSDDWIKGSEGSWNCVTVADINSDGRPDLLLGNDGQNTPHTVSAESPLRLYRGDLNSNGRTDLLMARKRKGKYVPTRSFNYLKKQFPHLSKKYGWYGNYVDQDISQIFGKALDTAKFLEICELRSMALINEPEGLRPAPLPAQAQLSSINDIVQYSESTYLFGGNELFSPIETGSSDGLFGGLLNTEGGNLKATDSGIGLNTTGMTRDIVVLDIGGVPHVIFVVNNSAIKVYTEN